MAAASNLSQILALLSAGSLVLTPNAASARALRSEFDSRQRASGLPAWEPPPLFAFTQWTSNLWTSLVVEGRELRLLLNQAQEHSLWREIVAAESETALGSVDDLADLARSAFHLAAAHNATHKLRPYAATRDTRLFAEWAEAFLKRCSQQQLLSTALLNDALRDHAPSNSLNAPQTLHLAGFLTFDPSQQSLLDALEANGCNLVHHSLAVDSSSETLRAEILAPTERDELALAARWTRVFLDQHPQAHVAIILPTLSDDRADLEVALRETLAPELEDIAADLSSTPWEFSTGQPLSSLALIADALDLARWALGPLPLSRIGSLLLSPYLGSSSDHASATTLDAQILRRELLLRPELDLPSLLKHLTHSKQFARLKPTVPAWLENLCSLLDKSRNILDKPQSFAESTELIRRIVHAANWPGERTLSAAEFEATRAWDSTLDLIATLDFSGRRVPFPEVLQALERQCRSTAFAPPSTNASVQILAPEDATATRFDAALFLRATDTNWPRSERPNPLLGFALQRELRMPGTDPAIASSRALQLSQDLAARSSTLLFTSAVENADGPQRSSPLLAQLQLTPIDADVLPPPAATIAADFIPDDLPLAALPSSEVHGGSNLLKLQATCGFRAFAELRLNSKELDTRNAGLDAKESGDVLHKALQLFWQEVKTRDTLAAKSRQDLDRILIRCIDDAFPLRIAASSPWDLAYLTLQKDRLRRLLRHWVETELVRSPFTVLASESKQDIVVGPLTLSVRVDRIDQVEGGCVFVDYKTGFAGTPRDWLGDRPVEPQLPLYAQLAQPGELKALLFAKVRAGKFAEWKGYQSSPGIFSNSRSTLVDLDAQTAEWRSALTRLAEDFFNGRAAVSPRSFEHDCQRCTQRLLCRIDPEALLDPEDDAEPTEETDA